MLSSKLCMDVKECVIYLMIIILHGKDDQQHDERLENLLERLQQRGLT